RTGNFSRLSKEFSARLPAFDAHVAGNAASRNRATGSSAPIFWPRDISGRNQADFPRRLNCPVCGHDAPAAAKSELVFCGAKPVALSPDGGDRISERNGNI